MNDFTIYFHFKDTSATWNESQVPDALTKRAQQLARQTDGLWGVVSHHAKRDGDVHVISLPLSYRRLCGDASTVGLFFIIGAMKWQASRCRHILSECCREGFDNICWQHS